MKICSLYGAGFYYVPGTDMCIKIGGWVRFEAAWGANGNITNGPFAGNVNNRNTNDLTWRSRGYITADARDQTAYGTVRGYLAVGLNSSSFGQAGDIAFSSNRAFIQWAGFTLGLAQSFYDFYSVPATAYWGDYPASDTGDPGWQVAGYTFQFGNGWSATVSAEGRRTTQIVGQGTSVTTTTFTFNSGTGLVTGPTTPLTAPIAGSIVAGTAGFPLGGYGGWRVPDIVGNLRVDQTWGSAQVMGALHQVNASYYNGANAEVNGGPSDKWGFAVGGGIKLNAPMIGRGDYLQAQVNYAEGASRYVIFTPEFNYGYRRGANAAYGILSDAVFGGVGATATDLNLTTSWGVNAAYEHFWNPAWRTSLYGGYAAVSYNTQANAILCTLEGSSTGGVGNLAVAASGCSNNWNTTWIGSRTQWNVTKDFYLGVDVLYQRLQSATTAAGTIPVTAFGLASSGTTGVGATNLNVADQDNWSFRFRAHRDFYP